jgi:hypothetical protein
MDSPLPERQSRDAAPAEALVNHSEGETIMDNLNNVGNRQSGKGVQGGTPEQHAEAGRQSHKNDGNAQQGSNQQSGNSTRGGTPEQHAEAGRQSHKNDGNAQSQNAGNNQQSGNSTRGGTPEQHAAAGRQSHKNDDKR